jgi:predicted nucleic acid-binding protein
MASDLAMRSNGSPPVMAFGSSPGRRPRPLTSRSVVVYSIWPPSGNGSASANGPCRAKRGHATGHERTSTTTAARLVDTNILVYRFDPRYPERQRVATELLAHGVSSDTIRVPHQAIVEFVAAVTRRTRLGVPLLPAESARREAEEMLTIFPVLYPNDAIVRIALRGAAAYQLAWYDAHLWAYAEYYGLAELLSEDFQHDRLYGTVRAVNPFADAV